MTKNARSRLIPTPIVCNKGSKYKVSSTGIFKKGNIKGGLKINKIPIMPMKIKKKNRHENFSDFIIKTAANEVQSGLVY